MMIEFHCPTCGRKLRAAQSAAGKKAKCRGCEAEFQVPKAVSKGPHPEPPVVEIDEETPEYQPEIDEEAESVRRAHTAVSPPHRLHAAPAERVQVQTPPAPPATPPPTAASASARTGGSIPRDVSTVGGSGPASVATEASTVLVSLAGHPKYKLLGLLGKGGMGTVYKAEHRVMQRLVALKMIAGSLINNAASVKRFEQEIVAAARLSHPNVVTAYDAEEYAGFHFLVMEFVEGINVGQIVETSGPLPVLDACDYVRQAAMGLQHAFEQGMVHRDIKPQHLIRTPDGRIKILDFGLARFVSENGPGAGLTESRAIMGTPDYVAPEQLQDSRTADIRADIYGLGCTLYFLLTGQPPFPAGTAFQKYMAHIERAPQSVADLRKDLPPNLPPIVERMMAKLPALRFQTPIEVAKALTPIIEPPASLLSDPDKPGALRAARLVTIPTNSVSVVSESVPLEPPVDTPVRKRFRSETGRKRPRPFGERMRRAYERNRGWIRPLGLLAAVVGLALFVAYKKQLIAPSDQTGIFDANAGPIEAVAFSADGTQAFVGGQDGSVRLWDLRSPKIVRSFEGGDASPVNSIAVSSDGRFVAAAKQARLDLWDLATGECLSDSLGRKAVAFIKDVIVTDTGTLLAQPGAELVQAPFENVAATINRIAVAPECKPGSPARKAFLSGGSDGKLWLRDVSTLGVTWRGEHRSEVLAVALSKDGSHCLSGGADGKVCLWDTMAPVSVYAEKYFVGHAGKVNSVAFSPDGSHALSGADDGTIRLWDAANRALGASRSEEPLRAFRVGSPVTCVAFHPNDNQRALSGSEDGKVRLWRLR
jgi:serine/threonine protein kinase